MRLPRPLCVPARCANGSHGFRKETGGNLRVGCWSLSVTAGLEEWPSRGFGSGQNSAYRLFARKSRPRRAAFACVCERSLQPKQSGLRSNVGSVRIDAVWFQVYVGDHLPIHVHGFYSETEVIIDLLDDGTVMVSPRENNPKPSNAKRSDVRKVLKYASANYDILKALWEKHHG